MTTAVPAWITENPTERRPTEILVPLAMKVGPVWLHNENRGRWYAALETALSDEEVWYCGHDHMTREAAWECAEREAKSVAHTVLGRMQ